MADHGKGEEKTTMAAPPAPTPDECQLGQLICQRTPYKAMAFPAGWQNQIEWDAHHIRWNFRGTDRQVGKAIRIPVLITYHNEATGNDETYQDWLLIGYEGGSGP
jgi:hypothetical protein